MHLVGCGEFDSKTPTILSFNDFLIQKIPQKIRPHFAEFFQYCEISSQSNSDLCHQNIKYLSTVSMKGEQIASDKPNTVGICRIGGYREIILRSDVYPINSLSFKILVWHELGHCLLDLDHVSEADRSSVMNPFILWESELVNNWPYFVSDLFFKTNEIDKLKMHLHEESYE